MLYALIAILLWTLAINHAASAMHLLDHGLDWLTTSRDAADRPDPSVREARVARAHANHIENIVVFAPLALLVMHLGHGDAAAAIAAGWAFFGARIVHVIVYAADVPPVRSLSHTVTLGAHATLVAVALGML